MARRFFFLVLSFAVLTFFRIPFARAQMNIASGMNVTTLFGSWNGSGFDPLPGTGRLDSDTWRPFGTGVPATAFGGTCIAGICARGTTASGTATSGGPGYYAILPAASFPPTTLLAMHSSDTGLSPGGVVLRLVNADPLVTIAHADVEVQWAQRLGIATAMDTLVVSADDCGAHGVTYPIPMSIDAVATTVGSTVRWQTHDASFTLDMSAAPITPGANACITFTVGTIGGLRDVIALGSVTVSVAPSVCGDGVVDPQNEECEPVAGTHGPCTCDSTCHFPTVACDEGDTNPCTSGVCADGSCFAAPITDSSYVAACDHDGNPCTFEGCVAGQCAQLSACMPASACFECDPTTLSCDAPVSGMAGCCTSDDDCSATCVMGTCDLTTGSCSSTPDPDCADAGVSDGGTIVGDAGVDAGSDTDDAGSTPIDASGSGLDGGHVVISPGIGFEGGGGCRCRAGGTNDARGVAWLALGLALCLARRRR